MCKPDKCNNCTNCPVKRKDWRLEATQSDLKLELDQRLADIKEYLTNASGEVVEGVLDDLLYELNMTIEECKKCGGKFTIAASSDSTLKEENLCLAVDNLLNISVTFDLDDI